MTFEELREKSAAKFKLAASLPDGWQRREILKSARDLRTLAVVKGWIESELQPPE
jgi:hypothetical protein